MSPEFRQLLPTLLTTLQARLRNEAGTTLVLIALVMIPVIGMGALVFDVGMMFTEKARVQNAVDAAALAAAWYLPTTNSATLSAARDEAIEIAALNGYTLAPGDITFSDGSVPNDTVTIHHAVTKNLLFAPVLGILEASPGATAVAQIGTVGGSAGAMPFGIDEENLIFGETYCLKLGTGNCGGQHEGNFHALDVDNTGNSSASLYEDKIRDGSSTKVKVGDVRDINTGDMAGPTRQGVGCQGNNGRITGNNQSFSDVVDEHADGTFTIIDWDSPRLVIVPIVDFGSSTATVVGFAGFFIEGCSGNDSIVGRFIQMVEPGTDWIPLTGSNDFGARAVRLVG